MSKMQAFVKKHIAFIIFLAVYIFVIGLLSPWGNFPVNDDWDNQLQILAFKNGDYRIHSAIDAAFILQPWLGYLWSLLFGSTFVSLRILTIFFSIGLSFLLYILLRENVTKKDTVLLLLAFFLNPLVLTSSLSFMTEIYFLFLAVLSFFYLDKYLKNDRLDALLLGSLFCGLSILMRQLGFIVLIAFLLTVILKKKVNLLNIFVPIIMGSVFVYVWRVYPRAGTQEDFIYSLIELKYLSGRLLSMIFVFPLVGLLLSPLLFRVSMMKNIFFSLATLILGYFIFIVDVLPLGNVFYLENLYGRTRYRPTFSLFDNVPFKVVVSIVVAVSLVNLLIFLVKEYRKLDLFLVFTVLGYYSILFFPEDIYDRYALPLILFTVVLITRVEKRIIVSTFATVLLVIMGFVLNWEYYKSQDLVYSQMKNISSSTGYVRDIYSLDIYALYEDALRNNDFLGEISNATLGRQFECYVDTYHIEDNSFASNLENFQDRFVSNPQMYNRRKRDDVRKVNKNLDKLIYNQEYFSFLYSPVGKSAFVGSFCLEE